jgi:hypothetical protein
MLVLNSSPVGVQKCFPGDIVFSPYGKGELAGWFEDHRILGEPKRGGANVLEFSLARWTVCKGVRLPLAGASRRRPLQGPEVL